MADNTLTRRKWIGRITFAFLGLFLIFCQLIPLETVPPGLGGTSLWPIEQRGATPSSPIEFETFADPKRWIMPSFLLLLTVTWVSRRPSFAPVFVIAAIFFLADMLFQRPPGLWTALVVILTEILRSRARHMRTMPFWLEWATVSTGIAVISGIYWFTLSMVLVSDASIGLGLLQLSLNILAYPLVVFLSYILFGVSRPAPGQVDELGHRI
ncbi:hypothetical protein KO486_14555 [Octadecabacter sp. B2R22]|nr:hypothetical protein [Octadecabacter sp. B2R22]MBU2994436.1 hypothetical protein [Octadecabacter sp. B2R22]